MTKSARRRVRLNKASFTTALFFLCVPLLRAGGESSAQYGPLSLQDCIDRALGVSPELQGNRLDLLAATAEVYAARASLWPSLTGTVTGEFFEGRPGSKFNIVSTTSPLSGTAVSSGRQVGATFIAIFGANVTYPIFKEGSIFGLNDAPAVEKSRAQTHALEWTKDLTREEVIYRITQAYVTTAAAQQRVEPVDRRVELLEQSLAITKEQQGKGLIIPADVTVTEEQLTGARALAKVIHEQEAAGALALTRMVGLPPATHIRLGRLPVPPTPPSASSLLGSALGQHPSLGVQRATIERAKQDWRLERFRLFPSVTLHGSAVDINDFQQDAHEYIAGVTVNVPIWDFGAQRATVRARKDTYAAEQARLGSVANNVASQILATYEQIFALSEHILTLQGEVGKLDRDFRVAQSQQQQGIAQPLAAIDTELQLVNKRDELAANETHRLLLYANLQRASGGTWKWLP
jgi:outer membrane protein TolC